MCLVHLKNISTSPQRVRFWLRLRQSQHKQIHATWTMKKRSQGQLQGFPKKYTGQNCHFLREDRLWEEQIWGGKLGAWFRTC